MNLNNPQTLNHAELARSGLAFMQSTSAPATVGFTGQATLWNDVGSGRVCNLYGISYQAGSPGAGENIFWGYTSTIPPVLFTYGKSLLLGLGGSSTAVRPGYDVTNAGFANMTIMMTTPAEAAEPVAFIFLPIPILIPPGKGFVVCMQAQNRKMTCEYLWFESPVS